MAVCHTLAHVWEPISRLRWQLRFATSPHSFAAHQIKSMNYLCCWPFLVYQLVTLEQLFFFASLPVLAPYLKVFSACYSVSLPQTKSIDFDVPPLDSDLCICSQQDRSGYVWVFYDRVGCACVLRLGWQMRLRNHWNYCGFSLSLPFTTKLH